MRNVFLKGIIFSLGFFLTVGIFIASYAAWTNLSTRTNGTTIDENIWNDMVGKVNELGSMVPPGAVMAFNLSNCPTGWALADGTNSTPDLRGEFIRGLDNGRGIDSGRVLGSFQEDMFKSHNHGLYNQTLSRNNGKWLNTPGENLTNGALGPLPSFNTSPTGGIETRPRNVALLYCIKQ